MRPGKVERPHQQKTDEKPLGRLMEALSDGLNSLQGGSAIILGVILGLMMAFDIYLNKAAFEANEGIKFLTALTAITIPVMVVVALFVIFLVAMSLAGVREYNADQLEHQEAAVSFWHYLTTGASILIP